MNLQQIEHLLALVETGSFSRAADKVHLTQPALSRSIQSLEEELGLPLFDRVGKRNELTPLGGIVLERARRIALEAHEIRHAAARLTDADIGTVRLGLAGASSALFAGPLLVHMLQSYPRIALHLRSGNYELQLAALRARAVDALLLTYRSVSPRKDLHVEVLPPVRSGFVCRKGHPLLRKAGPARFSDMTRFPLISTIVSDDVARTLVECYGDAASPQRWLHVSSEEISALIDAVRHTDAILLGVLASMGTQLTRRELVEVKLRPAAHLSAKFAFVTLGGRSEPPALEVIRSFCKGLVQSQIDAGH